MKLVRDSAAAPWEVGPRCQKHPSPTSPHPERVRRTDPPPSRGLFLCAVLQVELLATFGLKDRGQQEVLAREINKLLGISEWRGRGCAASHVGIWPCWGAPLRPRADVPYLQDLISPALAAARCVALSWLVFFAVCWRAVATPVAVGRAVWRTLPVGFVHPAAAGE